MIEAAADDQVKADSLHKAIIGERLNNRVVIVD